MADGWVPTVVKTAVELLKDPKLTRTDVVQVAKSTLNYLKRLPK